MTRLLILVGTLGPRFGPNFGPAQKFQEALRGRLGGRIDEMLRGVTASRQIAEFANIAAEVHAGCLFDVLH
jgi:hypothetical protein